MESRYPQWMLIACRVGKCPLEVLILITIDPYSSSRSFPLLTPTVEAPLPRVFVNDLKDKRSHLPIHSHSQLASLQRAVYVTSDPSLLFPSISICSFNFFRSFFRLFVYATHYGGRYPLVSRCHLSRVVINLMIRVL